MTGAVFFHALRLAKICLLRETTTFPLATKLLSGTSADIRGEEDVDEDDFMSYFVSVR